MFVKEKCFLSVLALAACLLCLSWAAFLYPVWLTRLSLRALAVALKTGGLIPWTGDAANGRQPPSLEAQTLQYLSRFWSPFRGAPEEVRLREEQFAVITSWLHHREHDVAIQPFTFASTYPVYVRWHYAGREAFQRTAPQETRLVLFWPGGDYVSGGGNSSKSFLMALSRRVGAPVVAVEYTRCPEALDLEVVHREAIGLWVALFNGMFIPENIILMGEGVGASIVMRLLHELALDSDLQVPGGVVLISPVTDLTLSYSSLQHNLQKDWTRDEATLRSNLDLALRTWMTESEEQELQEPVVPKAQPIRPSSDPELSTVKLRFPSKFKFPPTLIFVGEDELTFGDAQQLREACQKAGAAVSWIVQPNAPSRLLQLLDFLPEAQEPLEKIAEFVRQHWLTH
eukprot:g41589.t1